MNISTLRLAARSIRRSKVRSALMGLGLVVGVVSLTLTAATGEGARRAVQQGFRAMIGNLDVLLVLPGGDAQRGMATPQTAVATLSEEDAAVVNRSVPNVRDVGSQQGLPGTSIEGGGRNSTTFLFGVTPNWMAIRGDSLVAGRFVSADDITSLARVVVLGADVARSFFPGGGAVGGRVRLSGIEFEVVGVLAPNGAGPGGISMDDLAYIPLSTMQRRVVNRDNLTMISVAMVDAARWADAQAAVVRTLRERHAIQGAALNDFRVSSPQAMMARVANVDSTVRRALRWVGALALLIGAVAIANLMVAATVARRREIGTRRALGATRNDILGQFWAEAVIVAALAGVVGAILSITVTQLGARLMAMRLAVPWGSVLGTVAITLAIGGIAGYLPARRAASQSPSAALREGG